MANHWLLASVLFFFFVAVAQCEVTPLRFPLQASQSAQADPRLPPYETKWVSQRIDNFSFGTPKFWNQRYLVADKYWIPGRPILFYTGNEGDLEMFYANSGFMFEIAQKWGALVVFAEHRYYGKSMPVPENPSGGYDMTWLSAEQALADYAQLLNSLRQIPSYANSPVLAFGGSLGGMMAAWLRMVYPHLVTGVLASSAPMVQFQDLYTNAGRFNQIVTEDYEKVHPNCRARIRDAFLQLNGDRNQVADYPSISQKFKLCRPLQNASDVARLIQYVKTAITYMAMTNYPDATDFLRPLPAWPVTVACNRNLAVSDIYEGMAAVANVYYNTSGASQCADLHAPSAPHLGDEQWDYQACTEMTLPSSANGVTDFFLPEPWDLSAFENWCKIRFGVTTRPYWIPLQYGGFNITSHTNIIFSNGDLDPWMGGGILKTLNPRLPSIMIQNGAHHLDLRFSSPNDPLSVVSARQIEINYLGTWAREWYLQRGIQPPI